MTVIINEETVNQSNGEKGVLQEVCQDRKEFIVKKPPKYEDQLMKFYYSPKFSVDDVITYVLEKALIISKECQDRVYYIFYQILSDTVGRIKDRYILDVNTSRGRTINTSIEEADMFSLTENDYDVLGITHAEKDNVYKVTSAIMRMSVKKRSHKIQPQTVLQPLLGHAQPYGREETFDALGTTQTEKDNVFKVTAFLVTMPRK